MNKMDSNKSNKKIKINNSRMMIIKKVKIMKNNNKRNKINSRMITKTKMITIMIKSNLMSHDNRLAKTFYKTIKINFPNLTHKKTQTFRKAFKLKMEKLNSNYLKSSSLQNKFKSWNKFMLNSLLTIENKLNWLT